MGTFANLAKLRLSCSFCEECMPGSSAQTTTRPALTPVRDRVMKGSAATLRPTCFMVTMLRTPASDAPTAVSRATFSLMHHSLWMPSSPAVVSMISVEGVPGYPQAKPAPARTAPWAIASFPEKKSWRSKGADYSRGAAARQPPPSG